MRQLLSFAILSAMALAGTACGPSAASTPSFTRTGEFRVLIPVRPVTLNPNLNLDELAQLIGRSVFSHLLTLNEGGRLLPELAESWTISPDGRVYTFKLRRNVRWHDGRPLSSDDVRWTFETVARDGYAREALVPIESIATPDGSTVIIRLKSPWAPFASDLAGMGLAILPRHVYERHNWRTHPANEAPIGTGPFRFATWEGDRIVLDANPNYFRSGPYVQRVIFTVASAEEATAKLLAGEADYSVMRPASIDPQAESPTPLRVVALPTSARFYMPLNLRRAPFDDRRVRRAIAAAIDRLEILSEALGGVGAPAVGWYTPDVEWAYNAAARVPNFDPAYARRELDAAGLRQKGRERLRARMVVPDTPPFRDMAQLIARQLADVGVTVAIERVPVTQWATRVLVQHDFDMALMSGSQGPDPDALRRRFLADADSGAHIGYADDEFRQAVDRGARAVDIADRVAAYYRAQEILARDVPFIPLAENVKVIAHNRRVSGLPQLEARGLVGTFDFSLVKLTGPQPDTRR